jgi:hypothetical protein
MKELTTYLPSGLIGARALLVATFVGLPAAATLGWGLAWAQSLAHGAVASSICAVLAALVSGVVFALVADHARSRSVRANTLGALALLACLLLVRWWRAEGLPGEALWSVMASSPVSSWFSDAMGAVLEAFMLGVLTLFLSRTQARQPFSESAQQWAVKDMEGELWGESVCRRSPSGRPEGAGRRAAAEHAPCRRTGRIGGRSVAHGAGARPLG